MQGVQASKLDKYFVWSECVHEFLIFKGKETGLLEVLAILEALRSYSDGFLDKIIVESDS